MEIQLALNNYTGKSGPRLNCAQSVAAAFGVDPQGFAAFGGGQAPEGWCGAAYAAAHLTGNPEAIRNAFQEKAGAITCKAIRQNRILPCPGCVETAAHLTKEFKP
ncbi:hypothetical protein [Holophaga foetida]|uniref:hypothetical protein n=1 Tax=Holophaga foetida TaxID=35839 RepID=UPI0002475036|nr:hypothetical protein [Holophaga foetida]